MAAIQFGALTARRFDKNSHVGSDDFAMRSLLSNPIKFAQHQDLQPGEIKRDEDGNLKEMMG